MGKADTLKMIDPSAVYQLPLTSTALPYQSQGEVVQHILDRIDELHRPADLEKLSMGKGQPIIATGATSGVGKSRMLEELRKALLTKGYAVITVSYNTAANVVPTSEELGQTKDYDPTAVTRCFLSRLVCAMLPASAFPVVNGEPRPTSEYVSRRFNISSIDDVAGIIREKFGGTRVVVMMDECVQLSSNGDDTAMNAVISLLGNICQLASPCSEGNNRCVAVFTALSQQLIDAAQTNSGRVILSYPLPLLGREAVNTIVRARHPNATDTMLEHIFSLSAGHSLAAPWRRL
jgi:hypothetical protein